MPEIIFQNIHLEVWQGDITMLQVDAVVNAANKKLTAGGGLDGSIHRAAGPELFRACLRLGGCETGQAKITLGYQLPAKFIIHTVGPVYGKEDGFEASYLEDCYKNSLSLLDEKKLTSIAFPSIATGVYGFPLEEAAPIAMESVKEYLQAHVETSLKKIVFVCYTPEDCEEYKINLAEIF